MALRPAQVHPEEHLGPVGGLGPTGPGADREDRAALVVLAGEQERRSLPIEVLLELRRRPLQLRGQLLVARFLDELERRQEIVDA
jgi:hypothetical protein